MFADNHNRSLVSRNYALPPSICLRAKPYDIYDNKNNAKHVSWACYHIPT